jgi:acetyl-CoA carboxylase biotin carboxylase subunit
MKKIRKILVANRGEIALRVMRTAREMGIKTVAVYSDADKNAVHVRFADEAFHLGPPPSKQSYLNAEKIIEACTKLDVDAIHPGYGFLSENGKFAEKVERAGIIFIGPSSHAIEVMGNKISAKQTVANYNVPLVPGVEKAVTDIKEAKEIAKQVGYPVLIKASSGGGGKGMRTVEQESDLEEAMQRAISEATSAFGDGSVFIEKFITKPRHIEFQILGDQHGNIVHLFERECSIQRRHQKVLEEAPSSVLTPKLRKEMGEAAVNVARSCGYTGAGTVEFMVDDKLNFYFLEMNTRLQVEHPVTEMITGIDLVKEQIRIAEGQPVSFRQEELEIHGHSIEVRVSAEDPRNNFLPDIGTLNTYNRPLGPGIRVDDGYEEGMAIPIYYDPMIAKLIVHADSREAAMDKMILAIQDYDIVGIQTTLDFCKFVMGHKAFRSGDFDTKFVENYFKPEVLDEHFTEDDMKLLAAFIGHLESDKYNKTTFFENQKSIEWKSRA